MGVVPDKFLESKNVYRLLVLLALASVVANFFFPGALKSHALPNTVAMYSLRPVANYDEHLYTKADGSDSDSTENIQKLNLFTSGMQHLFKGGLDGVTYFGESDVYNAHDLTELQLVKYMQGCYGGELDLTAAAWKDETDMKVRTAELNNLQFATATGGDNFCTCIDDMLKPTVKYAAADYTPPADVSGGVQHTTDMTAGKYLANAFGLTGATDFTDTAVRAKYHEDITRLCIESAIPMHTVAYEDTAPTALLAMIGQLLLILAAVQIHASFVHYEDEWNNPEGFQNANGSKVDAEQEKNMGRGGVKTNGSLEGNKNKYPEEVTQYQWIKGLFAAGIVVVLVWQSISEYNLFNNTDNEYMNFRRKENRHHYTPVITIFAYVATGLAALVTLLFEFYMLKAHTAIATEQLGMTNASKIPALWTFHRNGNTAMVLKHIASDVPLIAGFCLLGIAVLMQCNVTATHSVIGLALLLAVAGFLQHVSNVIKGLYTRICARLDARLVTQLTLHDSYNDEMEEYIKDDSGQRAMSLNPQAQVVLENLGSKRGPSAFNSQQFDVETTVRPVLQYFGYSRLYIFLLVVIAAFVFVFVAKDTTHVHTLHTMLDGQLLYFSIAFVFCNVGFDILYETLPFMFESGSTEAARIYIILLYVIFFNVNQLMYFWRIPGA